MSDLIAITYKEEDSALGALNELTRLQKEHLIELEDAAVATMNQKGKVKVKQTLERQYTGTMATWGFFWGFLIGLAGALIPVLYWNRRLYLFYYRQGGFGFAAGSRRRASMRFTSPRS